MPLFKTKLTELQAHITAHPHEKEQVAVYKICRNIIKEEIQAIQEEMRSQLSVYAPDEQIKTQEKLTFGIYKASDVEIIFKKYLERLDNDV